MPPAPSSDAIAMGVELKKRAKRTSAARRSSAGSSPGARLITSVRDGPGMRSSAKAMRWRRRTGRLWPPRRRRSTSNCSVLTSLGAPGTPDSMAAPSPAMMSPSVRPPEPTWARS